MPPTQYREFRLTQWPRVSMVLLAFWVGQFIKACQIVSIPVPSPHITDTLNVSHWIKQKCLQTFPNPLLVWEVLHHFQQKTLTAASAPTEFPSLCCSWDTELITTHTLQMHLAAFGYVSIQVCDESPIPVLRMGWDLS